MINWIRRKWKSRKQEESEQLKQQEQLEWSGEVGKKIKKNNNKTMMQYFEWYLPEDGLLWKNIIAQAKKLKNSGINMVWLPPAYKGALGNKSVGYDVYDTYDLGEFEQRGSVATKYGTKKGYLKAIKALQKQEIEVLADVVLNHMMGADETEDVMVEEVAPYDREQGVSGLKRITAWTKFKFPGRNGKYSDFTWDVSNFSGIDWDEAGKQSGLYRFEGKSWNRETDTENGNFDFLMGADLDTDNPETVKAVTEWGKWYVDTAKMDGLRLDAVKHISFEFYRNWLKDVRKHAGRNFFAVGEYWSDDLGKLVHYLDVVENSMFLFDVPLHFSFLRAATSNGYYDMRTLFDNSLVRVRPDRAVTFVDNHDTQPGQSLYSFIPLWFKPIAYALILLRKDGIPCVFYGDYYGISHDNIDPIVELPKLIKLREDLAYGEQIDYFDDPSIVGFTRTGDKEHENSGLAVLITNCEGGVKKMKIGEKFAGCRFIDALKHILEEVVIDEEGHGEFKVADGSVSVWILRV